MTIQKFQPAVGAVCILLAGCGAGTGDGGASGASGGSSAVAKQYAAVSASAVAPATYNTAVQQLYIAYFGRPADTGGLANFSAALAQANAPTDIAGLSAQYALNPTIRALVDAFGTSAESNALYTGGTQAFVSAIYTNIFNRGPDTEGLAFWANAIDKGGLSKGNAALSIMAGALSNTTTQGQLDALSVTKKTSVSASFTATVSAGSVDGYRGDAAAAAARTMLAAVSNATDTTAFQSTVTATVNSLAAQIVPGAPTIGTATAGDGSASIAFTAPASTGGSAIASYTATCTAGGVSKTGTGTASPIVVSGLTNGTSYSCSVTAANGSGSGAASSTVSVTPAATASGTSSTAGVYCGFSQSVLNQAISLTSTVSITCSSTLRTIVGNGVPDHTTGTFPNSGNPNKIGAVNVSYSNTLTPKLATGTSSVAHKIGYANNGVPFDPATAESYQNAGVWKIEALNQTYFPFGVDTSNAHVQPDGAYHYHGMPEGYLTKLGKGTAMTLVGFALDGFPIYARYGYTTATDAKTALKVMKSSYRMKTSPDAGRPSTSTVAMGTFTQDYEYVSGLGDLDECNGRFGVTPEFPNGIYHYYITDTYPYIQRCVKGTPSYNGTVGN